MLRAFLLPETVVHENGKGPVLDLGNPGPPSLSFTFEIMKTVEQQSIDLSVWGSPDGENWMAWPIAAFQQKFYKGAHELIAPLEPGIAYLQARWHVNRWGKGDLRPDFTIYVFVRGDLNLENSEH